MEKEKKEEEKIIIIIIIIIMIPVLVPEYTSFYLFIYL